MARCNCLGVEPLESAAQIAKPSLSIGSLNATILRAIAPTEIEVFAGLAGGCQPGILGAAKLPLLFGKRQATLVHLRNISKLVFAVTKVVATVQVPVVLKCKSKLALFLPSPYAPRAWDVEGVAIGRPALSSAGIASYGPGVVSRIPVDCRVALVRVA
jgi:hypothetical protein